MKTTKQHKEWVVNSDYSKKVFWDELCQLFDEHKYLRIKISTAKQRTNKQNAALHVYFTMLAQELNDGGYDLRRFFQLRPKLEIPWNCELVKENLWKPIQEVMINKTSTADANTSEYTQVYETLNRFTAQEFGISILWPNKDTEE